MTPKQELAWMLHHLFCGKKHTSEIKDLKSRKACECHWYVEEQTAECWGRDAHLNQLEIVDGFLSMVEIKEPGQALEILKTLLKHVQALNGVISKHPKASLILKRLLTDVQDPTVPEYCPTESLLSSSA
jgi:hypothetical protein